jgi:YVTN family beta-propeller protein
MVAILLLVPLFVTSAPGVHVGPAAVNLRVGVPGAAYGRGEMGLNLISSGANSVIANIRVGNGPGSPTYDSANGDLYVPNTGSDNISVISGATNRVISSISVGCPAQTPTYDPEDGDLYMSSFGSDNLTILSGSSNSVLKTLPIGAEENQPAYDAANGDLYVASDASTYGINNVSIVSGATNTVIGEVSVGSSPTTPYYDPVNGDLYVANQYSADVSVISTSSESIIATDLADGFPVTPAYDDATGDLYVPGSMLDEDPGWMTVISGGTNKVVAQLQVGPTPLTPDYDSVNGDVYVPDVGSYELSVISGTNNTVVDTIRVGAAPYPPAFDSASDEMYVPNYASGNVSVVSGSTNSVVASIPVGLGPYSPAFDPANGDVYVPNSLTNNVSVIQGNAVLPVDYDVDFREVGLPDGTTWMVNMSGISSKSTGGSIEIDVPNGTYAFTISPYPGYSVSPASGAVTVSGASLNLSILFTAAPLAIYPVTFMQSGLPPGTGWTVTLSGIVRISESSTLTFFEMNGTYNFTLGTVLGHFSNVSSGRLLVDGGPLSRAIGYTSAAERQFGVIFGETGLPTGTDWFVTMYLGASSGIQEVSGAGSNKTEISFAESNGSYSYSIRSAAGYGPNPSNGTLSIHGAELSTAVSFARVYLLNFTESTLPAGSNWSVALTGRPSTVVLSSPSAGGSLIRWSDGGSAVRFYVSNGTYTYSTFASDRPNTTGSVSIDGKLPAPVPVLSSEGPMAMSGVSILDYVVIGVLVILVAIGGLILLTRRRAKYPPAAGRR